MVPAAQGDPAQAGDRAHPTGRRLDAAEALGPGMVKGSPEGRRRVAGARATADEIPGGIADTVRSPPCGYGRDRRIADTVDAVTNPYGALDELWPARTVIEGVTAFAQKNAPNLAQTLTPPDPKNRQKPPRVDFRQG